MFGCAATTTQPAPAQTNQPAPAQTNQPIAVVTRAPFDSVLEALVPAQLKYPDVFAAAVLAEDGSLSVTYDKSSSHASDFVDFVEESSSSDAVIHWIDGGLPIQKLPQLAAEASAMAKAAGFEVKGGSLSADGSTYTVLSPRVQEEQTLGFVSVGPEMVKIVVQGGDSTPEGGGET